MNMDRIIKSFNEQSQFKKKRINYVRGDVNFRLNSQLITNTNKGYFGVL